MNRKKRDKTKQSVSHKFKTNWVHPATNNENNVKFKA